MRLLLVTDSPFCTSAYAQQALMLAKALKGAGHEVIYYGHTYAGVPILYQGVQVVGNLSFNLTHQMRDLIATYVAQYNIDAVLTFKDPHVLETDMGRLPVPWIAFAPVDTEPASHMLIEAVQHATRVITPTRFSQQQLAAAEVRADYAPHAVDTDFFTPDEAARIAFRKQHGISENAFLVCMVANNNDRPSRKSLDQALFAFIGMMQLDPLADVVLWLHTDMVGIRGGVNLEHILMTSDNLQSRWIRWTDQTQYEAGCPPEFLRDLYRASDALLAPSEGEGFCVPIIEAAACGTPAIVTNFTALREVPRAGWRIPNDSLLGGETYWCPLGGLRFRPTRDAIIKALVAARTAEDKNRIREDARKSAMRYNLSDVMNIHWIPLFAQIEQQIVEAVLA